MTPRTHRSLPLVGLTALGLVIAIAGPLSALALAASTGDDGGGGLDQTIAASEPIATDPRVIDAGHADVGPRFVHGAWTLMIHDDTARADSAAESVWRPLDHTVIRVVDAARQTIPDDDTYSFLGARPGSSVSVIPQTQNPKVVWLGWNTQDPEAMTRMGRGTTFTLLGVTGPGRMVTYLQSGNFSAPEVLWDSEDHDPQPVFVDTNTHTHANWVFDTPGVYLAAFQVSATGADGTALTDVQTLRFAVGSATSTAEAMTTPAAITRAPATAPATAAPASRERDVSAATDQTGVPALIVAVAAVTAGGVLLIVVIVLVLARQARARRRAAE